MFISLVFFLLIDCKKTKNELNRKVLIIIIFSIFILLNLSYRLQEAWFYHWKLFIFVIPFLSQRVHFFLFFVFPKRFMFIELKNFVATFDTDSAFYVDVVSSVNTNQIPRLNPIMVLETPRIATAVTSSISAPLQSSALTIQSYMIPQGKWFISVNFHLCFKHFSEIMYICVPIRYFTWPYPATCTTISTTAAAAATSTAATPTTFPSASTATPYVEAECLPSA